MGVIKLYVIKMDSDNDKSLITTIKSKIYQGECNADTLVFLVPMEFENQNLADCTMLIRYILPNGSGKSEELEMDVEPYNDHYRYKLKASSKFTEVSGNIELWLSAIDMYDNFILKSGSTFIEITPSKKISDYLSTDDLDQLDKLSAKVELLEKNKADDILYDDEKKALQLSSNGIPIGTRVNISSAISGDDVIDFDDEIVIIDNGDKQTSSDDVINF